MTTMDNVSIVELYTQHFGIPLKEILTPLRERPDQKVNKIEIFENKESGLELLVTFYEVFTPSGYKIKALPTNKVTDEYVKKLIRTLLPAYRYPRASVVIARDKKITFKWVNK